MGIYSTRFLSSYGGNALQTYTVPAGRVAVVKDCILYNPNATATDVYVWIEGVAYLVFRTLASKTATELGPQGMAVANAGEVLKMSGSNFFHGIVSGYLLSAA